MVAAVLCGCAARTQIGGPPSKPETSYETAPEVTLLFDDPQDANLRDLGIDLYDNPWYRHVYRLIGVRPRIVWIPSNGYLSKIRLMIASKETFEAFRGDNVRIWIHDKAIAPLNDLLKDHGRDILGGVPKQVLDEVTYRGSIYGVPIPEHRIVKHVLLIRKDWLDRLGLPIPRTVSEFESFLRAVRQTDMDGNGEMDEYGLSLDMDFADTLVFAGAFGQPHWFEKGSEVDFADRRIEFWSATAGAREFYATFAAWWREGLVDPESLSQDRYVGQKPKFFQGKIGTVRDSLKDIPGYERSILENTNVMPEVVPVPPLRGPQQNGYMKNSIVDRAFLVNAHADQKAGAVEFLNLFASERGSRFVSRGIVRSRADGAFDMPNPVRAERELLDVFARFVPMTADDYWQMLEEELTGLYARYLTTEAEVERRALRNRAWHVTANDHWGYRGYTRWAKDILLDSLDAAKRYPDPLSQHAEFRLKFLTGELDALDDRDWGRYIEALTKAGLFEVLDEAAATWFSEVYAADPGQFSDYESESSE